MHKILSRHRNFVLSLTAIQASIFLHAKAPIGGRRGPPGGLRSNGKRLKGLADLTVQKYGRSRRFRGTSVSQDRVA